MFGIGISEIVLITIVAIVVVGPKNLPIALRAIGRAIAEFRRSMAELRKDVALDEVVDEVTRPLREGMAGVQQEMNRLTDINFDGYAAEYPEAGPDIYDALPESAAVYPDVTPEYANEKAAYLAKQDALRAEKERYAEKQRVWAAEKEAYLREQREREGVVEANAQGVVAASTAVVAAVDPKAAANSTATASTVGASESGGGASPGQGAAGSSDGKSSESVAKMGLNPKVLTGAGPVPSIVVKPVEGTVARSATATESDE